MESLSSRFSGRFSRNSRTSRSSKAAQQDEVESMTDVDAAITQTLWKNHRLIPPTSRYASYWFSLIICLVMYNAVYIPVELCFGEAQLGAKPPAHIAIDFFVDFLFLIDIAINFRTVYLDEVCARAGCAPQRAASTGLPPHPAHPSPQTGPRRSHHRRHRRRRSRTGGPLSPPTPPPPFLPPPHVLRTSPRLSL